ncbi:hypothetical protein HKD37_04G010160 [Glycine soja]
MASSSTSAIFTVLQISIWIDPLRQLIKILYDIYEKPVELMWDGTKFGIPNAYASFFLTYSDVNEIIADVHHAKDQRVECENYIQTWVKDSQRQTTVDGKNEARPPTWIEVKSHVQSRGYECGYYMWNIVCEGLKNDWTMWFANGTPLDTETITMIPKKWVAYFVKVKNMTCRKS